MALQYLFNVVILFKIVFFYFKFNLVLKIDQKTFFFKPGRNFSKTFSNPGIIENYINEINKITVFEPITITTLIKRLAWVRSYD